MSSSLTIYLMRHGEASWTLPDNERELTSRGLEQTRQALAQLGAALDKLQTILCSPYVRARQTAAVAEALTELKVGQHLCLTPDEPASLTLEALAPYVRDHSLIVAHQPLLGNLVSLLTRGDLRDPYPYATSEILELEMELWAPGCGRTVRAIRP